MSTQDIVAKLWKTGQPKAIVYILAAALICCIDTLSAADSVDGPADSSMAANSAMVSSQFDTVITTDGSIDKPLYPMSSERKEKLVAYSNFKNVWRFAEFFIGLGILALLLFSGFSARMRDWAQIVKARFFVIWLFLILFIVAEYVISLPFHIYRGFVVESDFGFMNQTFMEWWRDDLLGLLIGIAVGIIPMWFLYSLINKTRKWWAWFAVVSIPFLVFFIVIAPVVISPMFNEFEPLKDKQLEESILALASKAGIEGSDVFQVDGSKQSAKINAYVTGLFGSKRIVLYDTMIDNFERDEIEFVMGHEMGHYVMHHIWWKLLIIVLFIAFAFWLMNKTIHPVIGRFKDRFGFDRLGDIASLPLIMVFISVISFVFNPINNGASRYWEHQSDIYGMEITDVSGESAAIAFDKLSVFNLSDPDPHPIIEFWFYSHPTLKKRMEFVRGYRL